MTHHLYCCTVRIVIRSRKSPGALIQAHQHRHHPQHPIQSLMLGRLEALVDLEVWAVLVGYPEWEVLADLLEWEVLEDQQALQTCNEM